MKQTLEILSWVQSLGLALVATVTIADWVRRRTRERGWLALAVGLLGALAVAGRVEQITGDHPAVVIRLTIPVFLASGYALALFRHSVMPAPRRVLGVLFAVLVGVSASSLLVTLPSVLDPTPTAGQWALIWAMVVLWAGCVVEPAVRFWLASGGRSTIQRARLRALSAGYGGIVVLLFLALIVGVLVGPHLYMNEVYRFCVAIAGTAAIPLLYIGFCPPQLLRRVWSGREETALRRAFGDLLLGADPALLAVLGLDWSLRLVGAECGLLTAPGGRILATRGLSPAMAAALAALEPGNAATLTRVAAGAGAVLVAPLALHEGTGMIAVVPGPFTPSLGGNEVSRLGSFAVALASALERTRLVEALALQTARQASLLEELERSNSDLQEFASVASHDLQEPLRMVASYLQLLDRRYHGRLDDDAHEFLAYAVDGATRMQALINDLLAYSRAGAQVAMRPAACDAIVGTALSNLRRAVAEAGAEVVVEPLPAVIGDPGQLVQVMQNLISNALKFRAERAPVVTISGEVDGDVCTLAVRDNGIGIEERHLDRIFMIFKRLHSHEEYAGTGIGLSICKRIVERHGGRMWVESTPGEGSVFRIALPAAAVQPVTAAAGVEPTAVPAAREAVPA